MKFFYYELYYNVILKCGCYFGIYYVWLNLSDDEKILYGKFFFLKGVCFFN